MIEEGGRSKRALRTEPALIEEPNCCFISRRDDTRLFCCRCAHKRRASPLTCLAICFLVLTYNLLGAFLFLAIEGNSLPEETSVAASKPNLSQTQSGDLRSKTVERLWSITEDLNILYKENWTKLAAKELMDFQKILIKSMQAGEIPNISSHYDAMDYRWTFAGSFLYALTLITTIGHGRVTPKSSTGKLVAVAYACIGIPLIMLYLSTIGEALARNFRALYSKLCPARLKSGNFHTKADCLSRYSLPGVECRQFVDCDRKDKLYDRQKRTPFQAALNLDSFSGGYHWTCRDHTRVPIVLSLLLIVLYIALEAAERPPVNCQDKRAQVTFKIDSSNPTKFNSLPRRKSSAYGEESFQRNTPGRRSAGHAERCVEYFVPRSLSEFNLSGAGVGASELLSVGVSSFSERARVRRDKMVTFEDESAGSENRVLADDVFM
ncbi:jg18020 [Pararge aegeria aegeria]|uniref:Jg18020 protein n=1 Tax=Pararge aegeria aegeria TaxID=348720 RepID=A0A8S4RNA1_9NEOP|nr:jg18020 [Pararge aegeria aegeria]